MSFFDSDISEDLETVDGFVDVFDVVIFLSREVLVDLSMDGCKQPRVTELKIRDFKRLYFKGLVVVAPNLFISSSHDFSFAFYDLLPVLHCLFPRLVFRRRP